MKISGISTRLLFVPLLVAFLAPTAALAERDHFQQMDANGDGYLDQNEIRQGHQKKFEKMDGDSNGSVSEDEWTSAHREWSMGDRMKSWVGMGDEKKAKMQEKHKEMFGRLDTDGDGMVTQEEFMSAPHPLLDKADTDGDGRVSEDEYMQAKEKMKQNYKMKKGMEKRMEHDDDRMMDQRKNMEDDHMMDGDGTMDGGGY